MYCPLMTNPNADKMVERVKKLLELTKSTNEHEAAQAAARAAELMSEYAISEAMLQVVSDSDDAQAETRQRENIVEQGLPTDAKRRIAWRDRVAVAVAMSLDCKYFYWDKKITAIGRESSVQSWLYMTQYLLAEIDRLADEAWIENGKDLVAVGAVPKTWKGAFRLGAADTIAHKLYIQQQEKAKKEEAQAALLAGKVPLMLGESSTSPEHLALVSVRTAKALQIVSRDRAEVEAAFDERTSGPGWRKTATLGNTTRAQSGYQDGRAAGAKISLDNAGRKQLKG